MNRILVTIFVMMLVVPASAQKLKENKMHTTESGLQITLLEKSKGEKAQAGDLVSVHYTGRLEDNTVFDSSVDRGQAFEFVLGQGQVIKGWDEGITMLKVGEKAILRIPAELGYGDREMGTIPANSTLVFEVELISAKKSAVMADLKTKDTLQTASGLQYIIVSKGKGVKLVSGMRVKVHYSGFFADGSKFDSSVDRGEPIEITLGKGQVIPGWEEGIALLKVGDKARLIIPYQLGYGEMGRQPVIPPKATLVFDVEVIDAVEVERPKAFNVEGLDTISTASGLKYILVTRTEGQIVKSGSFISVHYTGYFENGEIFDSSVERGEPLRFQAGMGQVIPGWDEGLQLLKTGEKARLIIPYQLGYGENGYGPIPPKASLIFDVEIINVE